MLLGRKQNVLLGRRHRSTRLRPKLVMHVDDGDVVDQIEILEVDTAHLCAQQPLELEDDIVLIGDGPVECDSLVAVVAHETGVIADPQRRPDEDHEDGDDE